MLSKTFDIADDFDEESAEINAMFYGEDE